MNADQFDGKMDPMDAVRLISGGISPKPIVQEKSQRGMTSCFVHIDEAAFQNGSEISVPDGLRESAASPGLFFVNMDGRGGDDTSSIALTTASSDDTLLQYGDSTSYDPEESALLVIVGEDIPTGETDVVWHSDDQGMSALVAYAGVEESSMVLSDTLVGCDTGDSVTAVTGKATAALSLLADKTNTATHQARLTPSQIETIVHMVWDITNNIPVSTEVAGKIRNLRQHLVGLNVRVG